MRKIPLYNPLNEEFSTFYDINGDRSPVILKIPPKSVRKFDESVANHVKKHLAIAIYHKTGNIKRDRDLEMADIYDKISNFNE